MTSETLSSIERLKAGNQRFTSGVRAIEPLLSYQRMGDLSRDGQKPFAIILTCSDSRSPVEMIFDQGLGDLFVVRVAGNVVAPSLLASIEFAAANFGSSIILVMGHTQCGAIHAALHQVHHPENQLPSPHLEELVGRITPSVIRTLEKNRNISDAESIELATAGNVQNSMNLIREQSAIVRDLIQNEKIIIQGAILNISTGKVDFL